MEADKELEYKVCIVCKTEKKLTDFYFRKESGKYRGNCKKCKPLMSKEQILQKSNSPTKVCKICNVEKDRSEYQKAGGGKWLQPYCKPCDAERKKQYEVLNKDKVLDARRKYYELNKEVLKEKHKEHVAKNIEHYKEYRKRYQIKNKEIISQKDKQYRIENNEKVRERDKNNRIKNIEHRLKKEQQYRDKKTPEQKERDKQKRKEWQLKNRDVLIERYKERKRKNRREWCNKKSATDISFKILKNLRSRTRFALKRDGAVKSAATEKMLGCTISEFRVYFESLFTEGMTWDAFMKGEIHIDHKKPCKLFDLTKEEEQMACFNYKNLQPLWEADNYKKGANYLHKVA